MLINRIDDHRVVEVNAAWSAFFGRERDTIVGRTLEDVDAGRPGRTRAHQRAAALARATRNFDAARARRRGAGRCSPRSW
jgi:PAS domain-containing protein